MMIVSITCSIFFLLFYQLIQFARQEYIQDSYDEAICDIEGRLDWARSRTTFPFGMRAQIEVTGELLQCSKRLWHEDKWQQAYLVALRSQQAMDRAQNIYTRCYPKNRCHCSPGS